MVQFGVTDFLLTHSDIKNSVFLGPSLLHDFKRGNRKLVYHLEPKHLFEIQKTVFSSFKIYEK